MNELRTVQVAGYVVHRGALSPCERALRSRRQRAPQPRIGAWFVEQGLVGEAELGHPLHRARQLNAARRER